MNTLLVCCTILFVCVCIVYTMNKRIAAWVYVKTVNPEGTKPKSPYGLSRERNQNDDWGYCITKDGKIIYDESNSAVVYSFVEGAIKDMNILEQLEGYEKTKLK